MENPWKWRCDLLLDFFSNHRIAFFHLKWLPTNGVTCSPLLPGSQSPAVTSQTALASSLLPLRVLQIQALWDASPFSAFHPQVVPHPAYLVTPRPAIQAPLLITGLRRLGGCRCLGPSFVPRTMPSASSLIFSLATVTLCSHALHDFLLPAPKCLNSSACHSSPCTSSSAAPASSPAIFSFLCVGRVDVATFPESPSHTAQPQVNTHVAEVTDTAS